MGTMPIAFLPFPTAVLARAFSQGSGQATAAAFYGGVLDVFYLWPRRRVVV